MLSRDLRKRVIIACANFLYLGDKTRQSLSEYDDFQVSVKPEEYEKLSAEEKKKLTGLTLTDERPNLLIIKKIKELDLFPKELAAISDGQIFMPSYYEKHCKRSRPIVPRQLFNRHFNSKKKGGR